MVRSETGVYKPIRGSTYTSRYAKFTGDAHLQEAVSGYVPNLKLAVD